MSKERIVCVEWEDASFNQGYYDENDPERFRQIKTRTVGFLLKSSPQEIILSSERNYIKDRIDAERHIHTIPKKMIRRITELKE